MIRKEIENLLRSFLMESGYEYDFVVEVPEEHFGDFSTNIALVGAKHFKKPPREVAKYFVEKLSGHPMFEEITIAGPGFINFKVSKTFYRNFLENFLRNPSGIWKFKNKGKILLEYGSANPTGPLTVGHGRQVIIGDVLGNVLKYIGYDVTKEMYLNDAGRQIKLLAKSVWARYNQLLGYDEPIPEDGYRGEYVIDIAKLVLKDHNDKFFRIWNEEVEEIFKGYALREIKKMFDTTLEKLDAKFDSVVSEKSLIDDGTVQKVLDILKSKDLVYEHEGAIWFKVSQFENDNDKVLIKSDGSYTYYLTDIAYHYNKFKRGYDIAIDIFGSDHHGHLPRMYAAIKALDIPEDFLIFVLHQFVTLKRGNEIVKMSTRAGEFVTLDELIDEVGKDATRYFFAMVDVNTHLNFDLELAKAQTTDNPVYYVQYAHARISSLFENAQAKGLKFELLNNIELLENEAELKIIKLISTFDDVLERVRDKLSPHYLTDYLENLAAAFHKYYADYKIVDPENPGLSNARLNLALGVKIIISEGLKLLGVSAPEKM
ncbi:arginyl-tRNA synthetase [Fervidobacterium pennivorans DSM 9078]|jgi:arginyl-tRNA synthetase|uniref:Arginine--tRNA ligase n=1 Tax=Fervidobacterium pennivorans (strain DSM 9078 / Ven5) TaxID=771875 RepID=H9UA12_FERPD|nr:arginine--tRNA ligase [Fervidobacterium pennivorans]AFG34355.1 arginyl-tRNA synthetase [Fervidobacterium pennivorans DSM 9078]QIV77711.1 arginine--tRNA ligase [Fervidobacterium pennivorans subsp. keratinolyticus]